jgi:hypothetical protein
MPTISFLDPCTGKEVLKDVQYVGPIIRLFTQLKPLDGANLDRVPAEEWAIKAIDLELVGQCNNGAWRYEPKGLQPVKEEW